MDMDIELNRRTLFQYRINEDMLLLALLLILFEDQLELFLNGIQNLSQE